MCCAAVKDSLPSGAAASSEQGVGGGAVDGGAVVGGAALDAPPSAVPIHFLYGHLHNSIRTELDNLSNWVLALEADNEQDLQQRLAHLKERCHFLEQVYKYHSSVEDEVGLWSCDGAAFAAGARPCSTACDVHSRPPLLLLLAAAVDRCRWCTQPWTPR